MKRTWRETLAVLLLLGSFSVGCGGDKLDEKAGAPPPLKVERAEDRNVLPVEHPERFPLIKAVEHLSVSELRTTSCKKGSFCSAYKAPTSRQLFPITKRLLPTNNLRGLNWSERNSYTKRARFP